MIGTADKLFYKLSLKNKESDWENALVNSFPNKAFHWFLGRWSSFITPWTNESIAAKFSEMITLISIMLLVFLSPFASTEINAALVIFAVMATTMKHLLKPETIPHKTDILTFTVLAYFAMGLVAAGFSPYFVTALKGFAKLVIYFLAYFVFLVNLGSLKSIRLVIWSIIISASIMSLYGVYQYIIKVEPYQGALWDDPNSSNYKTTRVYSFLKNPNLLSAYLIPTASLTAVFYYLNLGWRKVVIVLALYLQLACLYFTYSRGGWIGAVAMAAVLVLGSIIIFWSMILESKWMKRGLIAAVIIGLAGVVIFLIMSPSTLDRFMTIFTLRGYSSNSFRMNVWISSFNMFKDNYLWGIGPGNDVFNKIYPLYMFSGFKALSAYNIFLETAIEMGIFGLLIFTFMLFAHAARCVWGIIADINYSSRVILTGCLAGFTGLVVQGMVDTVWYRPQVHLLFWLIMAIITIVSRDEIALKKFNE